MWRTPQSTKHRIVQRIQFLFALLCTLTVSLALLVRWVVGWQLVTAQRTRIGLYAKLTNYNNII